MSSARRTIGGLRIALGLLTVIPVRAHAQTDGIAAAAGWFPFVGALVGLIAGAVRFGADHPLGPSVAAVLAVITLAVLTGALHQDGLADLADALGVRGGRERRLEVMRGSTLGAFGVLTLVLWALLLTTTLAALPRHRTIETLVIAGALARWTAVMHAAVLRPARRDGLGAAFAPMPPGLLVSTAVALCTLAFDPVPVFAAFGSAIVATVGVSAVARKLLGGLTGDTLGATIALSEVVACVVLLAVWRV